MLITAISLLGCSREITYNKYEELILNLENMGFSVVAEDVKEDILQSKRNWLTINDTDNISVYLYESANKMEKDSSYLSKDGFSYDKGKQIKLIDWSSYPHFFKRDNIILLYIGKDLEIIQALARLVGQQFAGETKEDY